MSLHFFSYLNSLCSVLRKQAIHIADVAPQKSGAQEKHCILIHGWASDARAMRHVRDELRQLPEAEDWRFWDISYDTTWTPFPANARAIITELQKRDYDFSRTILIGYSMGGLVARQMVAEGFPVEALVTLCTPHHGPARWLPVPTRGPRSLAKWSRFTRELNCNPRDAQARKKYHFFAVTFRDKFGAHKNDGMVSQSSALGLELGEVASRQTMKLKYSIPVAALMPFDPHWRAMFPRYIQPAIAHIGKLMSNRPQA